MSHISCSSPLFEQQTAFFFHCFFCSRRVLLIECVISIQTNWKIRPPGGYPPLSSVNLSVFRAPIHTGRQATALEIRDHSRAKVTHWQWEIIPVWSKVRQFWLNSWWLCSHACALSCYIAVHSINRLLTIAMIMPLLLANYGNGDISSSIWNVKLKNRHIDRAGSIACYR